MKKSLSNISSQTEFKWLIVSSIIIFNLFGVMIGLLVGGQSYTDIEAMVVTKGSDYQIESYPILIEIIIAANSTNTENINFSGSTLYTDTFISEEFELMPGESVSSNSNYFLKYAEGARLEISFHTPSEPQSVTISIKGRSRTLIEILCSFRNPGFSWENFGYILIFFIPSLILSYLVFIITFFYIIQKQIHKTPAGKILLIETIVPILYLSFWLTLFKFFPPITLTPVIILTFLCSVIISHILEKKYQKKSPEFVILGLTFLITSIIFYLFYNPLIPMIYNKQNVWDTFPIVPIIATLLSSGVLMLFIGLRHSKSSHDNQ